MKNNLFNITISSAEPFYFPRGKTGALLVHGFTGTPKEMRWLGEYLAERGITVAGIRLAGHATSPSDLVRMRWQDWLVSIEDGLNQLSSHCDSIFIVGLSMGGVLSLVSAARYPLTGAVMISTPYEMASDWRMNFARPLSVIVPRVKKGVPDTADKSTLDWHKDYPFYPTRAVAEFLELLKIMRSSLKDIHIPLILISSSRDRLVQQSGIDKMLSQIQSVEKKHILLHKSGHIMTEDIEKDVVFSEVYNFITAHS